MFPDHFDHDGVRAAARVHRNRSLRPRARRHRDLRAPGADTPELRALAEEASSYIDDYELVVHDEGLREAIASSGAILIGYRELRDAMRAG